MINRRRALHPPGIAWLEALVAVAVLIVMVVVVVPYLRRRDMGPTRSRESRVRTDHRSLATAIEAYFVDHNCYPGMRPFASFSYDPGPLWDARGPFLSTINPGGAGGEGLTTPVPYITSLFPDPFAPIRGMSFAYYTDGRGWILLSPGRDGDYDIVPERDYDGGVPQPSERVLLLSYDPTNGIVSDGDLWRVRQ